MGKNKKKSVSNVIVSRPLSNGSDNDVEAPTNLTTNDVEMTLHREKTLHPSSTETETTQPQSKPEPEQEQIQNQELPPSEQINIQENKTEEPLVVVENQETPSDKKPTDTVELTEVQIEKKEQTVVASQKKTSNNCSSGWCSIL